MVDGYNSLVSDGISGYRVRIELRTRVFGSIHETSTPRRRQKRIHLYTTATAHDLTEIDTRIYIYNNIIGNYTGNIIMFYL